MSQMAKMVRKTGCVDFSLAHVVSRAKLVDLEVGLLLGRLCW